MNLEATIKLFNDKLRKPASEDNFLCYNRDDRSQHPTDRQGAAFKKGWGHAQEVLKRRSGPYKPATLRRLTWCNLGERFVRWQHANGQKPFDRDRAYELFKSAFTGPVEMDSFFARICWNTNDWRFPCTHGRHEHKDNYVSRNGFGHEEWLFNFAWLIGGYHYTFLQPVTKSWKNLVGKTLHILLYTIDPSSRHRVYVGEIRKCEVLTQAQAEAALVHYKKSGWLRSMKEHVDGVGGTPAQLNANALSVFNVRFQPTEAEYSPRLADPTDPISRLKRYNLVKVVPAHWRGSRKGSRSLPVKRTVTRSTLPCIEYDPLHPQLQGELMELLKVRFGEKNVERESDFVDLSVIFGTKKILVEIKSDSQARLAIRKALGQILEYAYFNADANNTNAELVIAAPGRMTEAVSGYLSRLHAKFGIPLKYCAFSLGDNLPDIFRDGVPHG
jgi:hypothetical protein